MVTVAATDKVCALVVSNTASHEKEITAVLGMDQVPSEAEIEQLSQNTSIDDVAKTIKENSRS